MKNNIYFFITSLVMLCSSINIYAQHVEFTYDAVGNRITRVFLIPRLINDDIAESDPKAQEIAEKYGISAYPNPLMDGNEVTVAVSSAKNAEGEDAMLFVLDNKGQILFSQKRTTASPSRLI